MSNNPSSKEFLLVAKETEPFTTNVSMVFLILFKENYFFWKSMESLHRKTAEHQIMAQAQGFGRRYIKAFFKGFFVAVPVTVTFLDRVACVARVEGASMQPSLNPGGRQESDVVLLNHWSIRNYDVQRGDIVSLVRRISVEVTSKNAITTTFLLLKKICEVLGCGHEINRPKRS
uniref:Mitochondrial inner membrane protease subunit 2 n=1 Tax=Cairina moschata TaxID=8855 RepID=A0A8C3BYU4_CAIMO